MQPVIIKSKDYLLTLNLIQVVLVLVGLIMLATWLMADNKSILLLPLVILGWVINHRKLLTQKNRTLRFHPSGEVTALNEHNTTTKNGLMYTVNGYWQTSGCMMVQLKAVQSGPVMDILVLRSTVGAHIFSMLLVRLQSLGSDIKQVS